MLHNTLPAHLAEIAPRLTENPLLVYQGFSPAFLQKILSEHTPLLSPDSYISADGQLQLPSDAEGRAALGAQLKEALAKSGDKPVALPFEHYWVLRAVRETEETWGRPVLVIFNNLTNTYPNFSTLSAPDYAAIIDKGEEPEVNPDFSFFYTNPVQHDNQLLIQYPAWYLDEEVETLPYFNELPAPDITVKELADLPPDYASYPDAGGSFTSLIIQVQQNAAPEAVHLVIGDSVFDKTAGLDLTPVNILAHLFSLSSHTLHLHRLPPAQVQQFRPAVQQVLQNHWGSDSFRSLTFYTNPEASNETYQISQGEIIEEIIQNAEKSKQGANYQDIFLTAPTGAGKSILFQIPAIYLAQTYQQVSIVISPLIALMNDQVEALHERGVPGATYINSELSPAEVQNRLQAIKDGEISIVYLSPELLLGYDIQYFIGERSLGLFIIDEAHTISTWGKEFRVDYWFLGEYLRKLKRYSGHRFPVVALTATAIYRGPHDMVFETVNTLELNAAKIFIGDVKREQISFDVNPLEIEGTYKKGRLAHTAQKVEELLQEPKKVLIYFVWVRNLREIHKQISPEARMKVGTYYSGMKADAKADAIAKFKSGDFQIILATKAFGMGVDISDIEVIYHNAPSSSFTDYVQEIGRAARKKSLTASAGLDFHPRDLSFSRSLFGGSSIKQWQIRATMDKIRDLQGVKQSPNLMLSPDSFAHIFNEKSSQDVEQKVKRTLMLIEKDLARLTDRTILRIRPHTVVNEVYARISKEIQEDFVAKYGDYAEKIEAARMQQRTMAGGQHMIMKEKPPVYKLQLASIWESNFPEYTYPQIRYHYQNKRL
ncbi:MAG: DEAD/DEAH box helicase, partial [Bacteroidota bacterium]